MDSRAQHNLSKQLDQLSKNKEHMLSDEAKKAVSEDYQNESLLDDVLDDDTLFEELLEQSKALKALISRLHLDELVLLLAEPFRLYPINMLLGFIKGLGFGLGLLVIWLCYQYFLVS